MGLGIFVRARLPSIALAKEGARWLRLARSGGKEGSLTCGVSKTLVPDSLNEAVLVDGDRDIFQD